MAQVSCEELTKEFSAGGTTVKAVDSVDLTVEDGTFVTILGPSGCGKTTLLRMIAGLETPTDGAINFGDDDVTETSVQDRHVGMVFQNIALFPFNTIRENIEYGLKYTDTPTEERKEKAQSIAEMLGIADLMEKKPNQLSGGQRQRAALGRALIRDPNVFLLDEPMSNLDAELKVSLRTELNELHKEFQTTTFYVTHDQEEAMTLSEEVIVIKDGEIEQHSTPFELFSKPNNTFVARFIGSPNINFFDGQVSSDQLEVDDFRRPIELPSSLATSITESSARDDVRIGIRPTALEIVEDPDDAILSIETELYEQLGSETILHAHTEIGTEVRAVVPPDRTPDQGAVFHVRFDPEEVHLFDTDTGAAIRHGIPSAKQATKSD